MSAESLLGKQGVCLAGPPWVLRPTQRPEDTPAGTRWPEADEPGSLTLTTHTLVPDWPGPRRECGAKNGPALRKEDSTGSTWRGGVHAAISRRRDGRALGQQARVPGSWGGLGSDGLSPRLALAPPDSGPDWGTFLGQWKININKCEASSVLKCVCTLRAGCRKKLQPWGEAQTRTHRPEPGVSPRVPAQCCPGVCRGNYCTTAS